MTLRAGQSFLPKRRAAANCKCHTVIRLPSRQTAGLAARLSASPNAALRSEKSRDFLARRPSRRRLESRRVLPFTRIHVRGRGNDNSHRKSSEGARARSTEQGCVRGRSTTPRHRRLGDTFLVSACRLKKPAHGFRAAGFAFSWGSGVKDMG